jgi:hypothetical protein
MSLTNGTNSPTIRIALIEPSAADAYWFRLVIEEVQGFVELIHYATDLSALDDWRKSSSAAVDIVVVADILPMLTADEFIDVATRLQPYASMVIVGEQTLPPGSQIPGHECYTKPMSCLDIQRMIINRTLRHQLTRTTPSRCGGLRSTGRFAINDLSRRAARDYGL